MAKRYATPGYEVHSIDPPQDSVSPHNVEDMLAAIDTMSRFMPNEDSIKAPPPGQTFNSSDYYHGVQEIMMQLGQEHNIWPEQFESDTQTPVAKAAQRIATDWCSRHKPAINSAVYRYGYQDGPAIDFENDYAPFLVHTIRSTLMYPRMAARETFKTQRDQLNPIPEDVSERRRLIETGRLTIDSLKALEIRIRRIPYAMDVPKWASLTDKRKTAVINAIGRECLQLWKYADGDPYALQVAQRYTLMRPIGDLQRVIARDPDGSLQQRALHAYLTNEREFREMLGEEEA